MKDWKCRPRESRRPADLIDNDPVEQDRKTSTVVSPTDNRTKMETTMNNYSDAVVVMEHREE
jgi:hypothetical protein